MTAFQGPAVYNACQEENSDADKPAQDETVGCFFLTDDNAVTNFAYILQVAYTYPVQQASGVLLDIDGVEAWTITAVGSDGVTVLDQIVITAGDPDTGDGVATDWFFDLAEDIYFLRFEQTGSTAGVGLAFDNFSPASLPVSVDLSTVPSGSANIRLTYPNPFNPQTTIGFEFPRQAWAEVAIYELTGRCVSILAKRVFAAGDHTVDWNGRDSQGRAMPSGTYIVRLSTDSGVEARKVSLIR